MASESESNAGQAAFFEGVSGSDRYPNDAQYVWVSDGTLVDGWMLSEAYLFETASGDRDYFECPFDECMSSSWSVASALKDHVHRFRRSVNLCPDSDCLAIFGVRSTEAFNAHLRAVHDVHDTVRLITCPICKQCFGNDLRFNNHLIQYHSLHGVVCGGKWDEQPEYCGCGNFFRNDVDLQAHKQGTLTTFQARMSDIKMETKDEVKLYSVELYSFAERRFQPPRDSVEPPVHGSLRKTDELARSGGLRGTDDVVKHEPMRSTDELLEVPAVRTSPEDLLANDDYYFGVMTEEERWLTMGHGSVKMAELWSL